MDEINKNISLNVLIIAGGSGAAITVTKLLNKAGHKVATSTDRGSEGSTAIRRAGGISLHIDPLRMGELHSMINMMNADVVINFGAMAANHPPYMRSTFTPEMIFINAESLARAVHDTTVKHIIHASFASVYGDTQGETADETAKLNGGSAVAKAARSAEGVLQGLEIPVTIFRTGFVYGPETYTLKKVGEKLKTGRSVFSGTDKHIVPWLYAGDLAQAAVLAVEKKAGDQIFNVVDDTGATPVDFMRAFAAGVGVGVPGITPAIISILKGNRNIMELTSTSIHVSNQKIKSELGWAPQFASKEEAIDQILLDWRISTAVETISDPKAMDIVVQ